MDTSLRRKTCIAVLLSAVACGGAPEENGPGDDSSGSGSSGSSDGTGGTGTTPDLPSVVNVEDVDPETLPDEVPIQSRVPRLSYEEYDRTVSALLNTDVSPSDLFPAEQPNLGPYEDGGARAVTERLLHEVTLAAKDLAEETVLDDARYASLVGCSTADDACRDSFLTNFGRRAYRRPLSAQELSRFQALFDQGADLVASGDDFRDGVQIVIEAILQSAKFLYRPEQGTDVEDEQGVLLSDYEIAARLSFMFWGRGPDDELLDAAAAGTLSTPSGLSEQVVRLAEDPRFVARVLDFHDRWMQLEGLPLVEKDASSFPAFGPALTQLMVDEMHAFVQEITLNRRAGIAELLTSPLSAVNDSLAALYDLGGTFDESFSAVEFPADSGRAGLLTRAAFLTGHSSTSTRTSPVLRGVFILDRILCRTVSPPPPGAQMQEPDTPPAGELRTTRQYFEWKTSMPECDHCHQTINPVGFAFEEFDGIGAYRSTENGAPVDTVGSLALGDQVLTFESAADFSTQIAHLSRTRACYAVNWLNYAYGREEGTGDLRTLGRISAALNQPSYGARELLQTITQGAAFTHLPPY